MIKAFNLFSCILAAALFHLPSFAAPDKKKPMERPDWRPGKLQNDPIVKNNMAYHAPLYFIENKGQVRDQNCDARPDIQFQLKATGGLSIFFGAGAIHYQFSKDNNSGHVSDSKYRLPECHTFTMDRMDVELVGANKNARVIKEQKQDYYENYFTNWSGEKGAASFAYKKITYKDIYPNIDWVLYIENGTLEHEFVVRQGGKVSDIKLKYGGAKYLKMNADGSIAATTPQGIITEKAPNTYQKDRTRVNSCFVLNGDLLSYNTGAYTGDLVIDPSLLWATYFGGTAEDIGKQIATDATGSVFFTGETASTSSIATTGAYETTYGGGTYDAYLVKFNNAGVIQWATYFGGTGNDDGDGIATDASGNVFITGVTSSTSGIATTGAYQTTYGGGSFDAFIAQFNGSGSLQWATYYGGTGTENGYGLATDNSGNVFITGITASTTAIATTGAYQTVFGGVQDAYLAKFNNSGAIQWATYFGGTGQDEGLAVATDASGNAYITGTTNSTSAIATTGAFQTTLNGTSDAYIAVFNSSGAIQWATYFGGNSDENGYGIGIDGSGNVLLCGLTLSTTGLATSGAYQTTYGGGADDAFLSIFSSTGGLLWSTYYGGTSRDEAWGVKADVYGNYYIAGLTGSTTGIATTGAYQSASGGGIDAFLGEFSSSGAIQYATYYGGTGDDEGMGITIDASNNVSISGYTSSTAGIATTGAYQTTFGGGLYDAFLAQFSIPCVVPTVSGITGVTSLCPGSSATLSDATPGGSWISESPSITTIGSTTGYITGVASGLSVISYEVTNTCGTGYATSTITVLGAPALSIAPATTATVCIGASQVFSATATYPVDLVFQDFNYGMTGELGGAWTVTNTGATSPWNWALEPAGTFTDVAVYTGTALTGDGSIMMGACPDFAGSGVNLITVLRSPIFSTVGYVSANVAFNYYCYSATGYDVNAEIDYSIDGGTTWTILYNYFNTVTGAHSWVNGTPTQVIALPAAAVGQPNVQLRWNYNSTWGYFWAVDNVLITGNLAATSYAWTGVSGSVGIGCAACGTTSITPGATGANIYSVTATGGSCSSTSGVTVTENPLAPVTGPMVVCPGNSVLLNDATGGGAWSSANTTIGTVSAGGSVTGVSAGNVVISYTKNGCSALAYETVGNNIITTVVGTGTGSYTGDNGPATSATINIPQGIAFDVAGNMYFCDWQNYVIRKVNTSGIITTIAGVGSFGYSGDNGPATNAQLGRPTGLAIDNSGNLFVCDQDNHVVRKINTSGIISTVAGNGTGGYTFDNVPATASELNHPYNIAFDNNGGFFIADPGNNRIRRVNASGIITTIAGTGTPGFGGDGGPATSALLNGPAGIAVDIIGNLYIPEVANRRVRIVNPAGIISTFAGNGTYAYFGDGGPATAAELAGAGQVYTDPAGNVYISDQANNRVRIVNTSNIINTFAGNGSSTFGGDNGPATAAGISGPWDISQDHAGNFYIADQNDNRIRKVAPTGNYTISGPSSVCRLSTIALTDATSGGTWISSNSSVATVGSSTGVVTGVGAGTAAISYVFTAACGTVYPVHMVTVNPYAPITGPTLVCPGNTISLSDVVGGGAWSSGNTAIGTVSNFGVVTGVSAGNVVISYTMTGGCVAMNLVTVGSPIITTIAGNGTAGNIGDGGAATLAEFNNLTGVAIDNSGNIFVADRANNRVRKINTSGIISNYAGNGTVGYTGDGGPATNAELSVNIWALATDNSGNLYIGDRDNNCIRMVSTSGIIITIAGNGSAGFSGDGLPATAAQLDGPCGVSVDNAGNVYIADRLNNRIREVNTTGVISTIAGNGTAGYGGDGSPANSGSVELNYPSNVYASVSGDLYIADQSNNRVRKISSGIITTVAGTGTAGYSGDGGSATNALLNLPASVFQDNAGNIYFTDASNNVVREVNTSGNIITVAGNGTGGYAGDGSPATAAEINQAWALGFDPNQNLIIADHNSNVIRKVAPVAPSTVISGPFSVCQSSQIAVTDATSGGTWISSNSSVATVGSATGMVNGVGAGTAAISYVYSGACGTVYPAHTVTVNPYAPITGASITCPGNNYTLSDVIGGGTWSSSNNAVGTVTTSGFVTGISAGNMAISYTMAGGCVSTLKVTVADNIITTIAGNGTIGAIGDGGAATNAEIHNPTGVVTDPSGNIYFSDHGNSRVRKINTSGIITDFAGNGTPGYGGDGGQATAANLCNNLYGLAADASGNIYIADESNDVIRKVNTSGIISTIAGNTLAGYSGDGIAATLAKLNNPSGVAVDNSGNVYISDQSNSRIRVVNTLGIINTFAGNGTAGYGGDGGLVSSVSVEINLPSAVSVDNSGNVYICDEANERIRKVNSAGVITTFAGTGTAGDNGDGSSATSAQIQPDNISVDAIGDVYISDGAHGVVRMVNTEGIISTLAGNGSNGYGGDGGLATVAQLNGNWGVCTDAAMNLYISDVNNNRLRKVTPTAQNVAPVVGATNLCVGATTTLTDATSGGTWLSTNNAVGTINSSGVVTGMSGGTLVILYEVNFSCGTEVAQYTMTINALPAAVTGNTSVCVGQTTPLSDGVGTWSSSNLAVGTIGLATGIFGGVSAGTAAITYTQTSTGCSATRLETVNPLPAGISGFTTVCAQSTTSLGDLTGGGTWSSSNVAVGTIGSVSGIVTGISPGTVSITFTLGTSCLASTLVTVNQTPNVIGGNNNVCVGLSTTLNDVPPLGTWSSSNNAVGSIGSATGVIAGVSAGTTSITYKLANGCFASMVETVNPLPSGITGFTTVCAQSTTSLGDLSGGGTWSSGNVAAGTIGSVSGIVTGIMAGTTIVTYTLGTGCTVTTTVIVNPIPNAIGGSNNVCEGLSTTLNDLPLLGTWSSSNSAVGSIGSTSGVITGVSAGTTSITYKLASGCLASIIETVNPLPSSINGGTTVCAGSTSALSDFSGGGNWTSSNLAVGTVGLVTGQFGGISLGTASVTYTLTTGCLVSTTVMVNNSPNAIGGNASVCEGSSTTLNDLPGGGVWSSSNTAIGTISSSGVVDGISTGTTIISYTLGTGCMATFVETVNTTPAAILPFGPFVCQLANITLSDPTGVGAWSSNNPLVASINAVTGLATGAAAGTTIITYMLGTCYATTELTVNPLPNAGAVTGAANGCVGSTYPFTDLTGGSGTWSSSNTVVALVDAVSGIVTGVSPGTALITYAVMNSCGTAYASSTITIASPPDAGTIVGTALICAGTFTEYSDATPGGTWSVSNATATIGTTGLLIAVTPGTNTISYSVSTLCGTALTTQTLAIGPYLSAGTITGASSLCQGAAITLTDPTPMGSWSASNAAATVTAGVVTGVAGGVDTISYTVSSGCGSASALETVTVIPIPVPGTIVGPTSVCIGSSPTYTDASGGGAWSVANGTASISGGGVLSPSSTGTNIISYSISNSCGSALATQTINIGPLLTAGTISGFTNVCAGSSITLSDGTSGGTWSATNTNAVVSAGVVFGLTPGIDTILYTVTASCGAIAASYPINVNPLPSAGSITGPASLCAGIAATYSDPAGSGSWSVANGSATISSAGVVTPLYYDANTISYTVSNSCGTDIATMNITINADTAGVISGAGYVCTGTPTTLTDPIPGGVWSASNTTATVTGGLVTGLVSGLDTISYTVTGSCGTAMATHLITVNLSPDAGIISGAAAVCVSSSTTYTDPATGGNWTMSNGDATITSGGVLTGVSIGIDVVQYTVSNACGSAMATATVTISTAPDAGTVFGPANMCAGLPADFTDGSGGGAWSSSDPLIASIGSISGVATGLTSGTVSISYTVINGCGTAYASAPFTVNPLPAPGTISGSTGVCEGSSITLTDPATGGSWTAGNADATVLGGVVTGVTAGADPISYTVTNSCGTASAVLTVTVNTYPVVDSVLGLNSLCIGSSITLTDATPGGTWSTSNPRATATSGIVTGISNGTDTVIYTVSNACASVAAIGIVNVYASPNAGFISGSSSVCTGAAITLTDGIAGGSWSRTNARANVTGGVVTGVSSGLDTIKYTATNLCGSAATSKVITVNPLPYAGAISGPSAVCAGGSVTLTDAVAGGAWSTGNAAIATVSGGIVDAIAPGSVNISYTVSNSCGTTSATYAVNVDSCANTGVSGVTGGSQADLKVYPNPNQGAFAITLVADINEPVHIIITDLLGQVVKEMTTTTNAVNDITLNAAAGVYLVTAVTDQGKYMAKITVE